MFVGSFGQVGVTPLTTPTFIAASLAVYFAVAFGLQAAMKARPAFKLTGVIVVHNAILCAWSALMFGGAMYDLWLGWSAYYGDQNIVAGPLWCVRTQASVRDLLTRGSSLS